MSRCYGGRASDKLITLESHILDKMDLQDALMADKGFFIEKECLEVINLYLVYCWFKTHYLLTYSVI